MTLEPSAPARSSRLPWIDAARGVAILAMIVYHFSWDLRFFGFIATDVAGELGWRIFAHLIAGTFLALVGVNLVLATRGGFNRAGFLRRLALVTAGAIAITVTTWFQMRDSYIFFGILHSIAVSSVLGLAFVRAPVWLTVAAAIFSFFAPALLSGPFFDHPALLWLGLATYFPQSNDYVPIFPWFGVVLAGIATARLAPSVWPGLESRLSNPAPQVLCLAGRYSLLIYLVHQVILYELVSAAAYLFIPQIPFLESCSALCVESDADAGYCERVCGCLAERSQAEGLWRNLMRNEMSDAELARYGAIMDECRPASGAQ